MFAAAATSSQTSRERIARRQHSPRCWPVIVMKPKLRIEAPFACASRSMTTTLLPRRAAAKACASPHMPAPTTARSKELCADGGGAVKAFNVRRACYDADVKAS